MSSPYHFSPHAPVAPPATPASASHYSLPKPRAPRPPILNPYDKFTQPEFDAWIGDITGALRQALGQEDSKPLPHAEKSTIFREKSHRQASYHTASDASDDGVVNDSFAEFHARRALGKGKARDPREGPGLGTGDSIRPIEIISSDEEEEDEVKSAIILLDGDVISDRDNLEQEEEEEGQGEEDEDEEEAEYDERYPWEGKHGSAELSPALRDNRTIISLNPHEGGHLDEGEDEEDEVKYHDEGVEYDEDEIEYDDDEVEYDDDGADNKDRGQYPRASPEVIDILSDDEEIEQSKLSEPRTPFPTYGYVDQTQDDYEVIDQNDEGSYSVEEADEERSCPRGPSSEGYLPSVSGYAQHTFDDEEEHDGIIDDSDDDGIQETYATETSSLAGKHLTGVKDFNRVTRSISQQAQVHAQEHRPGDESLSSRQVHAGLLPSDNKSHRHTVNPHREEHNDPVQPWSQDTSFPPRNIPSPELLEQEREVDLPDLWSGPRQYAQDYYSGGQINFPGSGKPDLNHLSPGDIEPIVADSKEAEFVDEIEEEIQPIDTDTSFPPQGSTTQNRGELSDPWAGPRMYAEDYYSGGDIRASPGEQLNPFLLRGTGDLDESINNFLTPSTLSSNTSNEYSSFNEDRRTPSNHSERQDISHPTEPFHVNESNDEAMTIQAPADEFSLQAEAEKEKENQGPDADARRLSGEKVVEGELLSPPEIIANTRANEPVVMPDTSILNVERDVDIIGQRFTPSITEATAAAGKIGQPDALGKTDQNGLNADAAVLSNVPFVAEHISSPSYYEVVPVEDSMPVQVLPSASNQQVVDAHVSEEEFEGSPILEKRADEIMDNVEGPVGLLEEPHDGSNKDEAQDAEYVDISTMSERPLENFTGSGWSFSLPLKHQPSLASVAEAGSADLSFPNFNNIPTEEEHANEKPFFIGQPSFNDGQYTVVDNADATADTSPGALDQVSESISISSMTDPLEDKQKLYEGVSYIVEEAITEGRLYEEPQDRGMSLDVVSIAENELEGEIDRQSPIFIERKISLGFAVPQVKQVVIPEAISENDKDAGLNPLEVPAPKLQDIFCEGKDFLSSASRDAFNESSASLSGDLPSEPHAMSPTSKKEVLEFPNAATTLSNPSASVEDVPRSPTPQISGDARDFVLSSNNEAFFSSNLPNYFGDLFPSHDKLAVQQDTASVTTTPPLDKPHKDEDEVESTIRETPAPPQAGEAGESHEKLTGATRMTQVVLTHNSAAPTDKFDAYPYNLSAPNPLLRLLSPSARLNVHASFNTLSSSSTFTQFSTNQNAPVLQASTPHISAPQTSVSQTKETNDRDTDEVTDPNTSHAEWDDLEFQYPSAQSIIEELKDVSSSKAEENKQTHWARTSLSHTEDTIVEKSSAIDTKALPVTYSAQELDTKVAALDNPPSATEIAEFTGEREKSKTVASVKPSTKRKRDISPVSPDDAVKPASSQKSKGRRALKFDRRAKSAQQIAETTVVASEDTIHVRPRPTESTDVFDASPTYRILQSSSRPSFTTPDSSDKHSAAQSLTTISKSSNTSSFPLPSLFHAHGKARKQQLLSNLPPKMLRQVQPVRSSPVSPSLKSPEPLPSLSATPAERGITPLEIPIAPVALSTSPDVQSDVSPAHITPLPNSPVSVTQVFSSPSSSNSAPAHAIAGPSTATITAPVPTPSQSEMTNTSHYSKPTRGGSTTSSPITRSHCRYHRISLPREEGGPRVTFLVPGCSLNDKELMEDEEIEDHGDATVEDSHRMIKDIESLNFHPDLIGVLRQLVGLDILREQEVFYLPSPGEDIPRRNSLMKSVLEKSAMVRVSADSSSYVGSPYSGLYSVSPGSFRATSASDSGSPSIGGLRSFLDSEKGSSFAPTDTEHSDGEEPGNKRNKIIGPSSQSKGKEKRKAHKTKKKIETEGPETGQSKKPRKSASKRGVKRSRTETINDVPEGQPNSKKLKPHSTAPGLYRD